MVRYVSQGAWSFQELREIERLSGAQLLDIRRAVQIVRGEPAPSGSIA